MIDSPVTDIRDEAALRELVRKLMDKCEALEARVASLEARPIPSVPDVPYAPPFVPTTPVWPGKPYGPPYYVGDVWPYPFEITCSSNTIACEGYRD